MSNWTAPAAVAPVDATVTLPGSKSITNRALIIASLATGSSTITGALRSRDTDLMIDALATLGIEIIAADDDRTSLRVTPAPLHGGAVECGLAGTVMRFVPPLAALAAGEVSFDGDEQARIRPLDTILDALRAVGAEIDGSALPFTMRGTGCCAAGRSTSTPRGPHSSSRV